MACRRADKRRFGAAKSYGSDGVVTSSYGALVDFKYRINGNKLFLSFRNEPEEVQVFEITSDKLILSHGEGHKEELTRLSGDAQSGIVGQWIGDHNTGAKYILHFTALQNCYLAVPMLSARGYYQMNGDKLTESYNEGKEDLKWAVHGNIMVLTDRMGKEKKYMRKE